MSTIAKFTRNVGVAPGTTTIGFGKLWMPWTDMISLNDAVDTTIVPPRVEDRPIRWDLIGWVGGGSLVVALGAAFIAAAIGRYIPEPRD